jgi:fructose-bisphosphate aldolase class II
MRVSLANILAAAERDGYAVIAPDFTSLSMAKAMISAAENVQAPLILSYSTLFKPIMDVQGYDTFIQIVRDEIEAASVPICLHLDHTESLEDIQEAVDVGYCSVMIDASTEPWEVNLEKTIQAVKIAHPKGVSVESELGQIMVGEGYYKQDNVEELFTDPDMAREFVERTGIDALAISIGNVHGAYQGEPYIDFNRLEKINQQVSIPLVLHGSSGIGEKNIKKAIDMGIRKINLYSEMINAAHTNMKQSLDEDFGDPLKLCQARSEGVMDVLTKYLHLSGSTNQI